MLETILQMIKSTTVQLLALVLLGVLGYALFRLRTFIGHWKPVDIGGQVNRSTKVVERLAELRLKLGAGRAYVFQFHNGEFFTNGSSILRVSCTHESVGPGVAPITGDCCRVLVSTITGAVEFLVEFKDGESGPYYSTTRDLPAGFLKSILISQGVVASVKYPLFREHKIVGYVGADYMDDKMEPNADLLGDVKQWASDIEFLVNHEDITIAKSMLQRIFGGGQ